MCANSVLPPFLFTTRAERREYLAGMARNELSECQSMLPMLNRRWRLSRASGLPSLPRFDTSFMPVARRLSCGFVTLPPRASSMAPKLRVNAICCSSVRSWSGKTSTACLSMPASIAATSSLLSGLVMSTPETSPAILGVNGRMLMGMAALSLRGLPDAVVGFCAHFSSGSGAGRSVTTAWEACGGCTGAAAGSVADARRHLRQRLGARHRGGDFLARPGRGDVPLGRRRRPPVDVVGDDNHPRRLGRLLGALGLRGGRGNQCAPSHRHASGGRHRSPSAGTGWALVHAHRYGGLAPLPKGQFAAERMLPQSRPSSRLKFPCDSCRRAKALPTHRPCKP